MKDSPKIRRHFLLTTLYLLPATFLIGCGTAPIAPELKETVSIRGTRFVFAEPWCRAYNIDYHWDPIVKKATFSREDNEVKLMLYSSTALVNNVAYTMEKETQFYQGQVVIPQSFVYHNIAPLFKKEYIEEKIIPGRVAGALQTVIIDPGHGGRDPGALGRGGLKEKDVTLDIARKLKKQLNRAGINVILTRASDEFVSLSRRAQIANTEQADFFISIHANASRSRWVNGVEVFYLSESIDDDLRSATAAQKYDLGIQESFSGKHTPAILWDLILSDNRVSSIQLAELVGKSLCKNLYQKDRGTKPARFYVLKGAHIPAILVEVGFISNSQEEKRLRTTAYRDKIAHAVAEGILQYNQGSYNYTARY